MKFSLKLLATICFIVPMLIGCDMSTTGVTPESSTGISKVTADIKVGSDRLTAEQRNVKKRLEMENIPGGIQYVYVLNSYTGQVMFSDVADGKVTSSPKRLTPTEVESRGDYADGFPITIGNWGGTTTEVLGDDGTYGSSVNYIYWFSATNGAYRQLFMTGGQQVILSDQPIPLKNLTLQVESVGK